MRNINWKQEGLKIICTIDSYEYYCIMPPGYDLSKVDKLVLECAEFFLLWGMDHNPIDPDSGREIPQYMLDNKTTKRKKGDKIGLSYSNGLDSAAALALLPENRTIPIYLYRDSQPKYNQNAVRGILNKVPNCFIIHNNFEDIRPKLTGKSIGFNNGIGYITILLLLADFLHLGYIAFGSILQTMYITGTNKFINQFVIEKNIHNYYKKILAHLNIDYIQPVAGLSEIATFNIVKKSQYHDSACSCQTPLDNLDINCSGRICFKCWRQYLHMGRSITPKVNPSIDNFLKKRPLKYAAVIVYCAQKGNLVIDELIPYIDNNVEYLERYFPTYLTDHIIDQNLVKFIENKLKEFNILPMNEDDLYLLRRIEEYFN